MPGVHHSHRINGNLKFLCMCDDRGFDRITVTIYYDSWICINFCAMKILTINFISSMVK